MRKLILSALVVALQVSIASAGMGGGGLPFLGDVVPSQYVPKLYSVKAKFIGDEDPLIKLVIGTTLWGTSKLPTDKGIKTACRAHISSMMVLFKKIDRNLFRYFKKHYDIETMEEYESMMEEYVLDGPDGLVAPFLNSYFRVTEGPNREDNFAVFTAVMTVEQYIALRADVAALVAERTTAEGYHLTVEDFLTCPEVKMIPDPLDEDDLPFLADLLDRFKPMPAAMP